MIVDTIGETTMPTLGELADVYSTMHGKQTELDRRIAALPIDDIDGKDAVMDELKTVVETLHKTVSQLARTRAADTAALRTKAAIIIGIGENDLSALCRSLAYDVVDVLESRS
jgi:hypothetical protein